MRGVKTVLTIAGFDPSSGAGVTADLMVFAAHGLFGMSSITALTVQSTLGVKEVHPVEASLLTETLACLEEDIPAAGIKIGMLGTRQAAIAVSEFIEGLRARGSQIPVVVDPVLRASYSLSASRAGSRLLDPGAASVLLKRLLPLADWVTPNMEEMGWLTGTLVKDRAGMEAGAMRLQREVGEHGGRGLNVIAKGGDLEVPDDLVLLASGEKAWLKGERVETRSTHGTGCAFSSALLCRLVREVGAVEAARAAKEYVAEAMKRAEGIGQGRGPMNLLWPMSGQRVPG
jgi:hydroxymethylpyrimidine/phosphomethylpyrimidine kinase